jgi:hypothetical protein
MLPFTKNTSVFGLTARVADGETSKALEPADGTYSLEASQYDSVRVLVGISNKVASAPTLSVQFYGKVTADGDVSGSWAAEGVGGGTTALTATGAAAASNQVLEVSIPTREIGYKYVTAIATITFADQDAATEVFSVMVGEIKRREDTH